MSFKYLGAMEKISFKYTPQPFARPHACYIIKSLFQPPSYIFQLETIVLDIGTRLVYKSNFLVPHPSLYFWKKEHRNKRRKLINFCGDLNFWKLTRFPKLSKLRSNNWNLYWISRLFCLLLCTSLLCTTPSLNRFTIKVNILTAKL